MTGRSRNILIVFVPLAVIGISIVGYGIFSFVSFFANFGSERSEIPAEIADARILTGPGFVSRSEIFKTEKGGIWVGFFKGLEAKNEKERQKIVSGAISRSIFNFSDIRVIGDDLIAVGPFGSYVLDKNGTLKRSVLFEPAEEKIKIGPYEQKIFDTTVDEPKIVDLEKGKYGYVSFNSVHGVAVYDIDGNRIWSYGGDLRRLAATKDFDEIGSSKHVLDATVGDLDGEGKSEYIVAVNNDGTHAFDQGGNELWFTPDEFPFGALIVSDINGDRVNELVSVGHAILDGKGQLLSKSAGKHGDHFLLSEGNSKSLEPNFCNVYEKKFECVNQKGETVFAAPAPLSEVAKINPTRIEMPKPTPIDLGNGTRAEPAAGLNTYVDETERVYQPKAVWIRLKKDEPMYLAVIAPFISIPRSNLYIYDKSGALVYHELLDQRAETIAILPTNGDIEQLLVGGKDTIWKYSAH